MRVIVAEVLVLVQVRPAATNIDNAFAGAV